MYVTFDVGIITNQLFLVKAANDVSLFIIIVPILYYTLYKQSFRKKIFTYSLVSDSESILQP